jgi:hypothetical protein
LLQAVPDVPDEHNARKESGNGLRHRMGRMSPSRRKTSALQIMWAAVSDLAAHIGVDTELLEPDARTMRMIPAQSIESVMSEIPASTKGYILPRGAALLPVSS